MKKDLIRRVSLKNIIIPKAIIAISIIIIGYFLSISKNKENFSTLMRVDNNSSKKRTKLTTSIHFQCEQETPFLVFGPRNPGDFTENFVNYPNKHYLNILPIWTKFVLNRIVLACNAKSFVIAFRFVFYSFFFSAAFLEGVTKVFTCAPFVAAVNKCDRYRKYLMGKLANSNICVLKFCV